MPSITAVKNKEAHFTFTVSKKEKKKKEVHLNLSTGIMRFLKSVTLNVKRHETWTVIHC